MQRITTFKSKLKIKIKHSLQKDSLLSTISKYHDMFIKKWYEKEK